MDKMLIICSYCLIIISSFSFGFAVGYNARQFDKKLDKKDKKNGNKKIIEKLEEIRSEIQNLFTTSICGATPYYNAIQVDEILNKHIEELKK